MSPPVRTLIVELVVAEVDRREIDRHVECAGAGFAVGRWAAPEVSVELAAPCRETAEVIGFEFRVRVVGIDGDVAGAAETLPAAQMPTDMMAAAMANLIFMRNPSSESGRQS